MKRLLAYSSIENIGIMFTGLGLAIVFAGVGMRAAAALTLIAVMYHALNHAFMKSLLFLGTGAVLHATGERNLGRLGGLIHRMPWVAWLTLIGALAIAGLPPLNGFVSEWLLLQSFLFSYKVPHAFINMLLPLGAALLALAAALAGYVMVKFFGVIFLGQPREPALQQAHDAGFAERLGLAWLALGCVLLGFFPTTVISLFSIVTQQLGLGELPSSDAPWWLLVPIPERESSYAPLVFFAVILVVVVLAIVNVRIFYHQRVRKGACLGLWIWRAHTAACKTRRKDSVSRFATCSNPSSFSFASCRAPSTRSLSIAWRLAIAFGALCMSPWVRSFGESRIRWLGCSKVASRLICSTVSSHSSSCWRSCYEDIRLDGPIDGNRVGAGRGTGVSRLGESVPSVAAE